MQNDPAKHRNLWEHVDTQQLKTQLIKESTMPQLLYRIWDQHKSEGFRKAQFSEIRLHDDRAHRPRNRTEFSV